MFDTDARDIISLNRLTLLITPYLQGDLHQGSYISVESIMVLKKNESHTQQQP